MKNQNTTVIEITETHLKVFKSTMGRGGAQLSFCAVKEISPQSDTELSKNLGNLLTASRVKPEHAIGVIARQFSILRILSLPSHSDEEISKMVSFQAAKQIPYPKEDIVLDYIVLNKEPSGYAKVLIIAVHQDVVMRYLKILQDAHVGTEQLALSSFGVWEWARLQKEKIFKERTGPVAVVNVDTASTEICFCRHDRLLFSRNINFGVRDINDEKMSQFSQGIDLTLATYAQENIGENIEKIVLVSSAAEIVLLKAHLEKEYQLPVVTIDPLEDIAVEKNLQIPELKKQGVCIAAGIGLALRPSSKVMDLMPKQVSLRREEKKRQTEYAKCLILIFVVAGLFFGIFAGKIYKSSAALSAVRKEISATQPKVKAISDKIKRVEFLKQYLHPKTSAIDVIRELYHLTPPEVSFSVLFLDESGAFHLQGVSESGGGVNIFQKNLVGCPLFKEVTLQYATKRKIFKGELTDFKITCQLSQK